MAWIGMGDMIGAMALLVCTNRNNCVGGQNFTSHIYAVFLAIVKSLGVERCDLGGFVTQATRLKYGECCCLWSMMVLLQLYMSGCLPGLPWLFMFLSRRLA